MKGKKVKRKVGFSIVEILVAAVLLSALIIPVVNLIRSSSVNISHGAVSTRALLLAQAKLEECLLLGFDELESQPPVEVADGRYKLSVEVEAFEGNDDVKLIAVLLKWRGRSRSRTRSIGLRTLRCRREGF